MSQCSSATGVSDSTVPRFPPTGGAAPNRSKGGFGAGGGGEAGLAAAAQGGPGVKSRGLSVAGGGKEGTGVTRAGARGYVSRRISSDGLAAAAARVAAGDAVFSPRLAGFVLDAFREGA